MQLQIAAQFLFLLLLYQTANATKREEVINASIAQQDNSQAIVLMVFKTVYVDLLLRTAVQATKFNSAKTNAILAKLVQLVKLTTQSTTIVSSRLLSVDQCVIAINHTILLPTNVTTVHQVNCQVTEPQVATIMEFAELQFKIAIQRVKFSLDKLNAINANLAL